MKPKKSESVNMEKKKPIFQLIGLLIVLSFILLAFEWSSSTNRINKLGELGNNQEVEEIIPVIRIELPKEEVVPPRPILTNIINIIPDDPEINDVLFLGSSESNENDRIVVMPSPDEEGDPEIRYIVEEMPMFPGCKTKEETDAAIKRFIASNIQYPEDARTNNVQGKVHVSFVINKVGKVTMVRIIRGVSEDLDLEALRVVQLLPDFSPGRQGTEFVRVGYNIPINFKVQ
ncbi:MAG: energy transducer TonB [Bacteroidales bacterium]|nr:energy transducer TonB [Bacteroidales bacterium]